MLKLPNCERSKATLVRWLAHLRLLCLEILKLLLNSMLHSQRSSAELVKQVEDLIFLRLSRLYNLGVRSEGYLRWFIAEEGVVEDEGRLLQLF